MGMDDSESKISPKIKKEISTKEQKGEKQTVGELFGVQMSAPKGMKNPLTTFLVLVIGNFVLLFFIAKGLGIF